MSDLDLGPAIAPISIKEQVYNRIRALIVSGRIPRSARMTENQLARQLGVSRTPVREALQTLETEGFLDAVPRSGYEVKMLLPEEMEGICEIRKVLECLAARWAIEHITADELQHLADNVAAAEAALLRGEPHVFIKEDADFHDLLARASRSRPLLEVSQILRRQMLLYRVGSISNSDSFRTAIAGHKRILGSIQALDFAGAEAAVCAHLEQVKLEAKSMVSKMRLPADDAV